jgi:hypothetical protein
MTDARFQHDRYTLRRKVLKLFGGEFRVFDEAGNLVIFSRQKAFKLREDIRMYTDDSMSTELLTISARKIIDWAAAYDVVDSTTGEKVGALKRRGWKSLARDSWIVMDVNDQDVGEVSEDSMFLALVRRLILNFLPQNYYVNVNGQPVAHFKGNWNPFVYKLGITFEPGAPLDRRLGLAACVLLAAIDGKQG